MGEELVEPAMVATMMMTTRGNEGESEASSSGEVAWGEGCGCSACGCL